MPFYLRKSIKAGPFRFNFSKSGVGVSVGVKGLRVGTGPRGHYVHAGAGGVYYRSTIARPKEQNRNTTLDSTPTLEIYDYSEPNVPMVEIESGDVLAMQDEQFSDILTEINAKQGQLSLGAAFGWGAAFIGVISTLVGGALFALVAVLCGLIGVLLGRWLDSYRRVTVLFYALENEAAQRYEELTRAFDRMVGCTRKWHISAGGQVQDIHTWKRNAGASTLLDRRETALAYSLPKVVTSNVTPPMLHVGRQSLYFLPDTVLIMDGEKFGAISYASLTLTWQQSNFIESGSVPSDTRILYHTWKHPNKSGGPDRRFADNHQIPVCEYEILHLNSVTGLNELVQFSCVGVSEPFATAIRNLSYARPSPRQLALAN